MSPIYRTFAVGGDELFIDLRRIVFIERHRNESDSSTIHMDPADHDLCLHDSVADPLREAWTAYVNGEHAPTPAVGVPGLPELPQGWEWAGDDYTEARCAAFGLRVMVRGRTGYEVVSIVGNVRADVVEMTIARHRARAGGAA